MFPALEAIADSARDVSEVKSPLVEQDSEPSDLATNGQSLPQRHIDTSTDRQSQARLGLLQRREREDQGPDTNQDRSLEGRTGAETPEADPFSHATDAAATRDERDEAVFPPQETQR